MQKVWMRSTLLLLHSRLDSILDDDPLGAATQPPVELLQKVSGTFGKWVSLAWGEEDEPLPFQLLLLLLVWILIREVRVSSPVPLV